MDYRHDQPSSPPPAPEAQVQAGQPGRIRELLPRVNLKGEHVVTPKDEDSTALLRRIAEEGNRVLLLDPSLYRLYRGGRGSPSGDLRPASDLQEGQVAHETGATCVCGADARQVGSRLLGQILPAPLPR